MNRETVLRKRLQAVQFDSAMTIARAEKERWEAKDRAEAAEKQLAEAQALLRAAGAAGFAMREQLVEAQDRIAELETLVPDVAAVEKFTEMLAFTNRSYSENVPEGEIFQYFRHPRAVLAAIRKYRERNDTDSRQ